MFLLRLRLALYAVLLTAFSTPAAADGPDEMWETTMKMEMPGMPMAMPPQNSRNCIAKGAMEESYVPKRNGECKTVDARRTGNKYNFKMVCEGKDKMTGVGEITFSDGAYDGRMQMVGTIEGQPMNMTQTYSGKRVGACTAPPKSK